jgi:hypothetical protein
MDFEKAATFIWQNGRLLERRLFDLFFRGGSKEDVLKVLKCFLSSKITQKNRVFLPIIVMGIFYRCFISACFIL